LTGYLADTNVALFMLAKPDRIPAKVRRLLERGHCHLSVITYWEVAIKSRKGSLKLRDPRLWWPQALECLAASPVSFRPEHVSALTSLPDLHNDPFDRALVAQAQVEELTLVTTDAILGRYGIRSLILY
jgi:PIN domain nuclease of toxin-antitoxin system